MVIKISSLLEVHVKNLGEQYQFERSVHAADIVLLNEFRDIPPLVLGLKTPPTGNSELDIKGVRDLISRIKGAMNTCTPLIVSGTASALLHKLLGGTVKPLEKSNILREVDDKYFIKKYSTGSRVNLQMIGKLKSEVKAHVLAHSGKVPEIIYYPLCNALAIRGYVGFNNKRHPEFEKIIDNYIKQLISNELYERSEKWN